MFVIDRRIAFVEELQEKLKPKYGLLPFQEPPQIHHEDVFDIAIPCFALAKQRKKAPPEIAAEIADQIKNLPFIEKTETLKGFLNIQIKAQALGQSLSTRSEDPLVDSRQTLVKERVLVEYSSPNIAKPFSVGHLRSTNIGASLSRIFEALGAEVVRVNHLGDWGTQFGKLICAYKRYGDANFVKGDPINNLYQLYVRFHEEEKNDPALMDEAREWFSKLEAGDDEAVELWNWFRDVSYQEFKKTYERLGVSFDYVTGESFYKDLMPKTVEELEEKSLLEDSQGAKVVNLEKYGMSPCLILKSDGSSLYATRDIATIEYRMETFRPTKLVYVVGGEQKLHFRQVLRVIELMGHSWEALFSHVDFGMIRFHDEKMSTRKGNIVLLENVLDTAEERVRNLIDQRQQDRPDSEKLSYQEKTEIARLVGVGAVIFFDLKNKRTKDVKFNWDETLSFEGDSGPYLQYTVVRLESVLNKAQKAGFQIGQSIQTLDLKEERNLAYRILNFPAAVEAAAREKEPSLISNELIELAAVANRFYMNVPVIKGDAERIPERLKLLKTAQNTLKQGLELLGVHCPKRM